MDAFSPDEQRKRAERRPVAIGKAFLHRGVLHPLVLLFLVSAFLSWLAADRVRALFLLSVGAMLAWDLARRQDGRSGSVPASNGPADATPVAAFTAESVDRRRAAMRRWLLPAVALGVAYSVVVGRFVRYSWPATIAVMAPSVGAVVLAWRSAGDSGTEPASVGGIGLLGWAFVWVGAAIWEVTALFLQPSFSTDSYAHPTLSYLVNPLLASSPGRSVAVGLWLAFGWYLARR